MPLSAVVMMGSILVGYAAGRLIQNEIRELGD